MIYNARELHLWREGISLFGVWYVSCTAPPQQTLMTFCINWHTAATGFMLSKREGNHQISFPGKIPHPRRLVQTKYNGFISCTTLSYPTQRHTQWYTPEVNVGARRHPKKSGRNMTFVGIWKRYFRYKQEIGIAGISSEVLKPTPQSQLTTYLLHAECCVSAVIPETPQIEAYCVTSLTEC